MKKVTIVPAAQDGWYVAYPVPYPVERQPVIDIFLVPIIAWVIEVEFSETDGVTLAFSTPVTASGVAEGSGYWIRQPDGTFTDESGTCFEHKKALIAHINKETSEVWRLT